MDLIERQKAIDALVKWAEDHHENPDGDDCIMIILDVPSAQSEIIRCKNCKYGGYEPARPNKYHPCDSAFPAHWRCYYYKKFIPIVSEDGFCSFAERRTDG